MGLGCLEGVEDSHAMKHNMMIFALCYVMGLWGACQAMLKYHKLGCVSKGGHHGQSCPVT